MLQRYRLRLGDGTVLLVDRDSLGTWLVDRKATVQAEGSSGWRPLREFLARGGAAVRPEPRRRPSVHESPPPFRASAPRDESVPLPVAPRADGLPLIPPPPKRPTSASTLRADGLPLVFPPPRGVRPGTPGADPARPEGVPPLAPETGPKVADRRSPVSSPETERETFPLEPAGLAVSGSESVDPAEPADVDLAPTVVVGVPETVSVGPAEPVEVDLAPTVIVGLTETASVGPAEPAEVDLAPTVIVGVPETVLVAGDEDEVIDAFPESEPGASGPHGSAGGWLAAPAVGDAVMPAGPPPDEATRDLPVIRFKPVEELRGERLAPERGRTGEASLRGRPDHDEAVTATRSNGARVSRREEEGAPAWAHDSRLTTALGWAGAVGAVLSRGLEPLNRLERGLPPFVVEEGALTWARHAIRRRLDGTFGWLGRVKTRRADRSRPPEALAEPTAPVPATEHAFRPTPAPPPSAPGPETPALRPESPPPSIERMAVLPVAEAWEAPPIEDVDEEAEGGSLLPRVWPWMQRVVLVAALLAAAAFATTSWQTWFPTAGQVGQMAFAEIDRQAHAAERAEQQRRIQVEASERLPYLAPETVQLILSHSPTGVLEIPDIFEAACDAADWGSWALTAPEADELRRLREQAIRTLEPVDQSRVDEYDRARASGLVFPLDNRLGALLWARGARGLPPPDQERLRALLGKAIAAGISPAGGAASRAAPEP